MYESKFFKTRKIFGHVTLITGLGGEQAYLIEGGERALLVDGLSGVGSLKAFVRELTELPVTLVNTHGHVDHIGADFEYGEVRIAPEDVELMYAHSSREMRLEFAKTGAMFAPLPTRGTVVFLDRDLRIVYSGDACNRNTLLYGTESTSIEQYRESLLHLKSFLPAFDGLWGGHGGGAEAPGIVDDAISLCDEIMAGTDDAIGATGFGGRPCLYAKKKDERFRRLDGGTANIAYSRDRIWKKDI